MSALGLGLLVPALVALVADSVLLLLLRRERRGDAWQSVRLSPRSFRRFWQQFWREQSYTAQGQRLLRWYHWVHLSSTALACAVLLVEARAHGFFSR